VHSCTISDHSPTRKDPVGANTKSIIATAATPTQMIPAMVPPQRAINTAPATVIALKSIAGAASSTQISSTPQSTNAPNHVSLGSDFLRSSYVVYDAALLRSKKYPFGGKTTQIRIVS
jgi:hypothetical protein